MHPAGFKNLTQNEHFICTTEKNILRTEISEPWVHNSSTTFTASVAKYSKYFTYQKLLTFHYEDNPPWDFVDRF